MTKAQKNYTRIINTTRILKLPKRFEDLSYTDVEKDFIFYQPFDKDRETVNYCKQSMTPFIFVYLETGFK